MDVVIGFACVVLGFYSLYFVATLLRNRFLRKTYQKEYTNAVKKKVSELDSKMTYVDYRGYSIPMTMLEKRTMWDLMTREARNKALHDFKEGLKEGTISQYKPNNN